jgi:phosphatidylinositol glycan class K
MFAKFNYYNFDKINSHPGVRSDLFNRPLNQTFITDFFGGVAQVEVTPPASPSDSISPHPTPSPLSQNHNTPSPQEQEHEPRPRPVQLKDSSILDISFVPSRELRVWSSVVIMGLLVGWVTLRK